MLSIFVILFLALYSVLAWRRLERAVMVMLAALPVYLIRFNFGGIPLTLLEAMILTCFTVLVIMNRRHVIANVRRFGSDVRTGNVKNYLRRQDRYPFDVEIMLLLVISYIAVAVSGWTDAAFGIWKAYFFEPALVFILIINIFAKRNEETQNLAFLHRMIWPLAVSAFAVSLVAIFQKITGLLTVAEFLPRVTGVFPYPNALGLYLGPMVLVLIGRLFTKLPGGSRSHRVTVALVIILSLAAIYFAKSWGAMIGVMAGLIVFGLLVNRWIRRITVAGCTIGIIVLVGMYYFVYRSDQLALGRINSCLCEDYPGAVTLSRKVINKLTLKSVSGEIRKQQWRETWEMLADGRLVFGSGLANYQQTIAPYHQEGIFYNFENDPDFRRKIFIFNDKYKDEHWQPVEIYLYPHNIFLNFWTELGLGGMLLFIWIIGKYFWSGFRGHKYAYLGFLNLGLVSAMVVVVVHGLVDAPYFKNDLAVMFWVLVALMSLVKLSARKTVSPDSS